MSLYHEINKLFHWEVYDSNFYVNDCLVPKYGCSGHHAGLAENSLPVDKSSIKETRERRKNRVVICK